MTPNILLITTDQQRFDHLGLKGVRGIDTPNLDRLGREGVHFDRAYTACPVCTPARLTLLTGQYPSIHGGFSIGVTVDPFPEPTIAGRLTNAGYDTALFGKAHFVRRADEESHFTGGKTVDPDYYRNHTGPFVGFRRALVEKGHTIAHVPGMHYRVFLEDAGVPYESWFPDLTGGHDHARTGSWDIPPEYHDTSWVAGNTIDWIEGGSRDPEKPWFCWASFQDPHEPFVCPEPWYSSVRTEEMELYEDYREGEFDDKPSFYKEALEAGFGADKGHGSTGKPTQWESFNDGNGIPSAFNRTDIRGHEREALRATLGMIAFIDDRVGAILDALERTGQAENTVVIFTTDHGEIHGHHGLWHKGLFPYDDNHRIPLLVWGPPIVEPRGTVGALANLADLPRTILKLAKVPIPQGMQGVDLAPVLRAEANSVQDSTIVELQATRRVYQQTFITDRYKLVLYRDSDEGELYDMVADPDQYRNLFNRPEYRHLRESLMHAFLRKHMKREGETQPRRSFA